MSTSTQIQAEFTAAGRVAPSDATAARMAYYVRYWGSAARAVDPAIGGVGSFFTREGHEDAEHPEGINGRGIYQVCDWLRAYRDLVAVGADQKAAA